MRNYFVFNGKDSRDYGVYISGSGVFNGPSRAYDPIEVPGRDGDLLGLNARLNNVELTYPAFAYANIKQNIDLLKGVLLGTKGYAVLSDSYHPDEFRLAYYPGEFEAEMTQKLDAGEFDITFLCKPQRYLNSGAVETTYTNNFTITNPTAFAARPLLHVIGNGDITIGDTVITIDDAISEVYIDSELMDCYLDAATPLNSYVSLSGNEFPVFESGATSVTLGSTITSVGVTPRWWRV